MRDRIFGISKISIYRFKHEGTTIVLTTVTWNNIYVGQNSGMQMQHYLLLHVLNTYRTDNIIPVFQDISGYFRTFYGYALFLMSRRRLSPHDQTTLPEESNRAT